MTDAGNHVFISYRHQGLDNDYAHMLQGELKRRGFEVWIDDRIDYGSRWPQVIQEQLDASGAVIVIMTPRSYASDWVHNELARAKAKRKPILPLLLEGDYWLAVQATQCVDVTDAQLPPPAFFDQLAAVMSPKAPKPPVEKEARTRARSRPVERAARTSARSRPVETAAKALARTRPFEPEMILIPAGVFLMGSHPRVDKKARKIEQPQHRVYLPDYYLAKTPVTNGQYLAFVQATGHPPPTHLERPSKDKEDHPVVGIDWDDARAYCRWLAESTGRSYKLPSEAEWEKGARGTHGIIYPWGNKWNAACCNSREGGKGVTTPVGVYPQGASPYGLLDMAGNVWEWTRSQWERGYPYDPTDGREDTNAGGAWVLRGGAFYLDARGVRSAFRFWNLPDLSLRYVGFRVCIVAQ